MEEVKNIIINGLTLSQAVNKILELEKRILQLENKLSKREAELIAAYGKIK